MFTEDDLNTLIDALKAWENKDLSGQIMADVIGFLTIKKGDPGYAEYETERLRIKADQDRAQASRRERSVILQAKLLDIRNNLRTGQIEKAINGGV